LWTGITNVPVIVASCLLVALLIVLTYVQVRAGIAGRRVNIYPSLICGVVVATALSRICGPFLIVPLAVVIMTVSMITQPQMLRRPVICIAICMMGVVVPLVLEALGVLGTTWRVDQNHFVFRSTAVHIGGIASQAMLIGATLGGTVMAGAVSWMLAATRHEALQRLELQSWRLMQLVPESVRQ
jgi:hypothetical protein